MHVISRKKLREFYEQPQFADAEGPLAAWFHEAKKGSWKNPAEIKALYSTASLLKKNRVVFNIGGNKYRLIARINYTSGTVFIRFVGTHAQYDAVNAEEV